MNKIRDEMKNIGEEAIRIKALYKVCNKRGYHNKIDKSYTDWKGNFHQLEMCIDCRVYFSTDED